MARDHRRLAAIVSLDVVGYSRLMGVDDSGTLAALKAHRRELIDPKIAEHDGRIVKTTGDGLLLEFSSVVDAVRCAVEVQRGMAERNADVAPDKRLDFRIGINVGDIIIDGDDIFGDGVNVAARLEALAEPGGICISGKVYDEVAQTVDCHFEDRGPRRVKNIALPVRIYAFRTTPAGTALAPEIVQSSVSAEGARLYGRTRELSALRVLIEQHNLVTVVGPAGIGKTRLAEAVTYDLRDRFSEQVQVELAPLSDPALVAPTVARALGLVAGDARTALDLTVQAVAGQRLLFVLDNCEHLLDAVDQVVAAMRKGAPTVHILATSQELLRHPDEHVFRLGTLALPDEPTAASAREAGAVELFVARAQAVEPRFLLSDENVGAVVEICRRLDGIALALELAAARVPLLGVEGVRDRLDERFRLLTAGSRLALRRHQTLRAALEWSHGLLSEQEKTVFDVLGVFAGSFSLASAQELAADETMDQWVVLDQIGALIDKSLVSVEGRDNSRYRMLETMRAFALERLAARSATPHAMRRHAEVILRLFERFRRDHFEGPPSKRAAAADALAADHDNLRQALRWACEEGGDRRIAIALIRAAGSTMGYFRYVALRAEAWDLCNAVRPLVDDSVPVDDAAAFWLACAEAGGDVSPAVAVDDAERATGLYRTLGDRRGAYVGCKALAFALLQCGRLQEAKRAVLEALELRDRGGPLWMQCLIDNVAALAYLQLGNLDEGRRHAVEFLAAARVNDSPREEKTATAILADLYLASGQVHEAAAMVSDALSRHPVPPDGSPERSSERSSDGLSERIFATAMMCANRLDESESLYRAALFKVRRSIGSGAPVLYDAATLLARRGRIDDAARVWAYADAFFTRTGRHPRFVALLLRDRLLPLLAAERPAEVLSRLYDEGRQLTDDAACALAFPASAGQMSPDRMRRR